MKRFKMLFFIVLLGITVNAQKYTNTENSNVNKEWNGNIFSSSKSLAENITLASNLSLMNRALKSETILNALASEEMITVFVISNNGFEKLQERKDSIFDNSNAKSLHNIITYHVIPGRVDSHSIKKSIEHNKGIAYFATLQGDKLGIKEENGQLLLVDQKGNKSYISATNFYHKNGFFHIVDGFVLPNNEN